MKTSELPKNNYLCFICGVQFHRPPSRVKTEDQTCSKACAGKKQTLVGRVEYVSRPCLICGKIFSKEPSKIRNQTTCSYRCAGVLKGSKYFGKRAGTWKGGHTNVLGYRVVERGQYEHRKVMEAKLGRKLRGEEIVHHIDGNKLNNHPDNLEIVSRSDHMKMHDPHGWRQRQCA